MQYTCKLSFSALIISSCLVQVTSADENANKSLKIMKMSSGFSSGVVGEVSALITRPDRNAGISSDVALEGGNIEIVENGGISTKTHVKIGGIQIVTRGGTSMNTTVLGGRQFVFEEGAVKIEGRNKSSSAYDAVIYGHNGTTGQQNIYDNATAWNTQVKSGGEQNLYQGQRYIKGGGIAQKTTVFENGRQHVLEGGKAYDVTLNKGATQIVYPGGYVKNLEVKDGAHSWVYGGGELEGIVQVAQGGHLHLYAGDTIRHITKERIFIEHRPPEELFAVGEQSSEDNSRVIIDNLTGKGGTVSFSSVQYETRPLQLYVDNLLGQLHFNFNISSTGQHDYLIVENGSGNHTVGIADSGVEIADFFVRKHDVITEINLIHEKSGNANFTLANRSGNIIGSVDIGTYMYSLNKREKGEEERIWYLGLSAGEHRRSGSSSQRRSKNSRGFSSLTTSAAGVNTREVLRSPSQSRPPRHLTQENPVSVASAAPSLEDKTLELNQEQQIAALSAASSLENHETEAPSRSRRSRRHLSQGEPSYVPSADQSEEDQHPRLNHDQLASTPLAVSYSEYQVDEPSRQQHSSLPVNQNEPSAVPSADQSTEGQDSRLNHGQLASASLAVSYPEYQVDGPPRQQHSSLPVNQNKPSAVPSKVSLSKDQFFELQNQNQHLNQKPLISAFVTSPSTDAVLSMAVVPGLVFNNELHSLRSGRGILDRNRKNTALWTYAIKGQERIATGHTHFKLDQTGVMLGVDRLSELTNGAFYLGGFGGYDKARIAHKRGGVSNMDVYSMGVYATYFDNRGWYLDGVLKYNHYQNNLKAVSTNGLGFQGDYKQWAIGTLFEAGYRFQMNRDTWAQPYGQLTWSQVEGKKIKLSNGMTGDIVKSNSLRSEIGLSVGHEFNLDSNASLMTYVTAAWLHQYIDSNHTTINKWHQFTTDLSDNAGKIGIGLKGSISDNLTFYGEAYYLKGQKREHSLQGNLGIRYRF
ncbi:BafA family autotransporter [Bartonella sp. A05]|uniref:BafA family autotransporter n=1 Tax=Bartonella sp. A05 TaxID=2967261 RepID=UPI0022A99CC5|nr:BafA family autotransporter [Bartonella sp. A05]MCZ2203778.1 BafA family autotransporter [Bartonella sp. A05]